MKQSKLKLLRESRGMSLSDVAEKVPCDKSAVSFWERRLKEPSPDYRLGYAKALKLSIGALGSLVYESTEEGGK